MASGYYQVRTLMGIGDRGTESIYTSKKDLLRIGACAYLGADADGAADSPDHYLDAERASGWLNCFYILEKNTVPSTIRAERA